MPSLSKWYRYFFRLSNTRHRLSRSQIWMDWDNKFVVKGDLTYLNEYGGSSNSQITISQRPWTRPRLNIIMVS